MQGVHLVDAALRASLPELHCHDVVPSQLPIKHSGGKAAASDPTLQLCLAHLCMYGTGAVVVRSSIDLEAQPFSSQSLIACVECSSCEERECLFCDAQ